MTKKIVAAENQKIAASNTNKHSFKADVLRLVSGTGLAQLIALLASPVITRLYSPDVFGIAAVFLSLTGIVGVLVCMRYELAIVLPDSDRDGANLFVGCLLIASFVALFVYGSVHFFGSFLIGLEGFDELESLLYLLPLAVLANGYLSAIIYWKIRCKSFTRLAVSRVISSIVTVGGTIGLGLMAAVAENIIFAAIGGVVVGAVFLIFMVLWRSGRTFFADIHWVGILSVLKRYKKFPLYSSWSALMNAVSWQLPVLMLGVLFSPYVAGAYALGFRVLQLPMNLVGGAVGQVFLQRAASSCDEEQLGALVESFFSYLLMFSLVPCLVLTISGEEIFVIIFGQNWAEAGIYAQVLAPWAIVWFVSSPLSGLYTVLEKQEEEYIIHGLILLTRVIAIAIGAYMQSALLAVVLFSVAGFLSYGYLVRVVFIFCGINSVRVICRNGRIIFGGLIIVIPPLVAKIIGMGDTFIVAASVISIVLYLCIYSRSLISINNVLVDLY